MGSCQFRLTSSVVVTFVQVMQSDTTWPARSYHMNRFVQILSNRFHTLAKNAPQDE